MTDEISHHGHVFPGRGIAKCFGFVGEAQCPECAHDARALSWLHHLSGMACPLSCPGDEVRYYQALRTLGLAEWVSPSFGPHEGWQITPAGRDLLARSPWSFAQLAAAFEDGP